MEVPEFDIFKRTEILEKKTWGVSTLDALVIALVGLELAILAVWQHDPGSAREWKDNVIGKLQK